MDIKRKTLELALSTVEVDAKVKRNFNELRYTAGEVGLDLNDDELQMKLFLLAVKYKNKLPSKLIM